MNPPMQYSKSGLDLTKGFEQFRSKAYQDTGGVWTIAWGHTHNVKPGDTCTPLQGDKWLLEDLQVAEDAVNTVVTIQLTQGEFDALVDFSFNCGTKALSSSHLLMYLNEHDILDAANEFEKWDHVGGKVVAGLLKRRTVEYHEFLGDPEC